MKTNIKKLIASILVITNIVASNGFGVLAGSVEGMIYKAESNEKELKNYYYLYEEEIIDSIELNKNEENLNELEESNVDSFDEEIDKIKSLDENEENDDLENENDEVKEEYNDDDNDNERFDNFEEEPEEDESRKEETEEYSEDIKESEMAEEENEKEEIEEEHKGDTIEENIDSEELKESEEEYEDIFDETENKEESKEEEIEENKKEKEEESVKEVEETQDNSEQNENVESQDIKNNEIEENIEDKESSESENINNSESEEQLEKDVNIEKNESESKDNNVDVESEEIISENKENTESIDSKGFDESNENETDKSKESVDDEEEATKSEINEDISIDETNVEINKEINKEVSNEVNETNEIATGSIIEEVIASESELRDVLKTNETEKEKCASESEIVFATDSEVEEENIASSSEIEEENIATENEINKKTTENAELSTKSEIKIMNATKSTVVVATVPVVVWKIEKVYMAPYTEIDVKSDIEKETIKKKLAKKAKVLVSNNLGEKRIITVNLKWKLDKQVKIATRGDAMHFPYKKEKWQKDFGIDKLKQENKNEIKATSNELSITEKVVEDIKKEHGNDAVVVLKKELVKDIDTLENNSDIAVKVFEVEENEVKDFVENIKESDYELENQNKEYEKSNDDNIDFEENKKTIEENNIINNNKETENKDYIGNIEEIETAIKEEYVDETLDNINSIRQIIETELNETESIISEPISIEDKLIEEEIKEPTVAGFVSSENEDEIISLRKSEINNTDVNASVAKDEEIDDTTLFVKGVDGVESDENLDGHNDLLSMDIYTVDGDALVKQVLDKLNNSVLDENEIEEQEEEVSENGFFEKLLKMLNLANNEESVSVDNGENLCIAETTSTQINKIDSQLLELPLTGINLFGLAPDYHNAAGNIHTTCGMEAVSGKCAGHVSQTGVTIEHNEIEYNEIDSIYYAMNRSTISITTDTAFYLKANPGSDTLTIYNDWKVESGINLYICTNGINLHFATSSRICGNGNVHICNCKEQKSKITSENDWEYIDSTILIPRYENRWYPIIDANNIYVFGLDNSAMSEKNIEFYDIKINNYFSDSANVPLLVGDISSKVWSTTHGYGSVLNAAGDLEVYHTKFNKFSGMRTNGVLNSGTGITSIYDNEFDGLNVGENGAAICLSNDTNKVFVNKCTFSECLAYKNGGAIYIEGDGVSTSDKEITNCYFAKNIASISGATIYMRHTKKYKLAHLVIENNKALNNSSIISLEENTSNTNIEIHNIEFNSNTVEQKGALLYANTSVSIDNIRINATNKEPNISGDIVSRGTIIRVKANNSTVSITNIEVGNGTANRNNAYKGIELIKEEDKTIDLKIATYNITDGIAYGIYIENAKADGVSKVELDNISAKYTAAAGNVRVENSSEGESLVYRELGSLTSDGNRVIDTKYVPKLNTKWEIRYKFSSAGSHMGALPYTSAAIWNNGNRTGRFAYWINNDCTWPQFGAAPNSYPWSYYHVNVAEVLILDGPNRQLKAGSNVWNYSVGDWNAYQTAFDHGITPIFFFGTSSGNASTYTATNKHVGTIYYSKIWENGTLVRDFVPCELIKNIPSASDSESLPRNAGATGLWDKVGNKFYVYNDYGTTEQSIKISSVSVPIRFNKMKVEGTDRVLAIFKKASDVKLRNTEISNSNMISSIEDDSMMRIENESKVVLEGKTEIVNNIHTKNEVITVNANARLEIRGKATISENTVGNTDENKSSVIGLHGGSELYINDDVLSMENNRSNYGAIGIYDTSKMFIEGHIDIKGNKKASDTTKELNVYVKSDLGKYEGEDIAEDYYTADVAINHKVASKSIVASTSIGVTTGNANTIVYRNWNSDSIASWNEGVYYTPDRIFKVDTEQEGLGYKFYKVGTYSNVGVALGDKYVTLKFKREDDLSVVIATQYIARGTKSYVDRVKLEGMAVEDQEWLQPSNEDEEINTTWIYYPASYNELNLRKKGEYEILLMTHLHTICGRETVDTERHIDGEKHTEIKKFIKVKSEEEIRSLAGKGKKYFALATDVEIKQSLNIASGSAICLNGHNMVVRRGVRLFSLVNGESITFTDCKHSENEYREGGVATGSITTGEDREEGYSIDEEMMKVEKGRVNLYNINIASMSYREGNKLQNVIKVGGEGEIYLENVNIVENEITKDYAIIRVASGSGKIYIASVSIIRNKLKEGGKVLKTGVGIEGIKISTISIIENEGEDGIIEVEGEGGYRVSSKSIIRGNRGNGIIKIANGYKGKIELKNVEVEEPEYSKGIIYASRSEAELKDYDIRGINYTVLYVGKEATVSIIGESTMSSIGRETIEVDGNLVVGNKFNIKEIRLNEEGMIYGEEMHKIATGSKAKIKIASESIERTVFKYWNEGTIENFGNEVRESENKNAYVPDEVFSGEVENEYEFLEYIGIENGGYNTGYIPNEHTVWEVDYQFDSEGYPQHMGTRNDGTGTEGLDIFVSLSQPGYTGVTFYDQVAWFRKPEDLTKRHRYVMDAENKIYTVDGRVRYDFNEEEETELGTTTGEADTTTVITHPIWIGASECGGGDYYKANGKIYRSKIYESGVLVKEYIPAKRVSDGKKGLYEKVNKEFIVSAFTPVYHGEEERAERIYKSGTYSNVELKLGIEYATIRFKKETEPNIILATQYVAKNVETYVDRVEVAGMEIGKQEWLAPAVENENVNTIWVFYEASRNNIKVGKREVYDIEMLDHIHTMCGKGEADIEEHYDGTKHTEKYNFIKVRNEGEINALIGEGKKYFELGEDIRVTKALSIPNGGAICLNGHKLKIEKGVKIFRIGNGETVTFLDCKKNKGTGMITRDRHTSSYSANEEMLEVTKGTISFYNINIGEMSFDNTEEKNNQKFIRVKEEGKVVIDNVKIATINTVATKAFIEVEDSTGKIIIASASIVGSRIEGERTKLIDIEVGNGNIRIGTLSIIGNKFTEGIIRLRGDKKLEVEKKLYIEENDGLGIFVIDKEYSGNLKYDNIEEKDNNRVKGLMAATKTEVELKDLEVRNFDKTVLYVGKSATVSIIGSSSVAVTTSSPSIVVDGKVILGEKFTIGSLHLGEGGVIKGDREHKIASGSKVRVSVERDEQVIYEYWNSENIEEFNKYEGREVYLPEEIFEVNGEKHNISEYKIYKSGTYSEVELKLGKEYAPLVFKKREEIIATQYVAKNKLTYVDRVRIEGLNDGNQMWVGPEEEDETKETIWLMDGRKIYNASISEIRYVKLMIHEHKICGATGSCTHKDGERHNEIKRFMYVHKIEDIINEPETKYYVLATDVEVRETHVLASGSAICLNGHKLIFKHGDSSFIVNSGDVVNFCDCGGIDEGFGYQKGCITEDYTAGTGTSHSYFESMNNAEINFFGINIATFNITSADDELSLTKVRNGGKIRFFDVIFTGNELINGKEEFFKQSIPCGKYVYSNVIFKENLIDIYDEEAKARGLLIFNASDDVDYASISFIGNTSEYELFTIKGLGTANISTISFMGNTVNMGYAFIVKDNAIVNVNNEIIFDNNAATSLFVENAEVYQYATMSFIKNRSNGEGAAICLKNAKLEVNKPVIATGNFTKRGAGLVMKGPESKLIVNATMSIIGNEAHDGSAIALFNGAELKLSDKIIMKNNTAVNGALYIENSKVIGNGYVFSGNNGTRVSELLVLNEDLSEIKISSVSFVGGKGDNLIFAITKKFVLENVDIIGNELRNGNSLIELYSTVSELHLRNVNIKANTVSETTSMIKLNDDDKLILGGKIVIKDNKSTISGVIKNRNLYVDSSVDVYGDTTYKLSSDSEIYVTVKNNNDTIYKYWNEYTIASFNNIIAPNTQYAPNEIFYVDNPQEEIGYKIYKSGTYSDVELKLGDNFEILRFKEKKKNTQVLATQYVAKNTKTYVDKVILDSSIYPIGEQEWLGLDEDDENNIAFWNMNNAKYNVTLSTNAIVTLNHHKHTICGNIATDTVAHTNGEKHKEKVSFTEVYEINDILSKPKVKYFELEEDLVIGQSLNSIATGSVICLNGHKLEIKEGSELFNIVGGKDITFTDCKRVGGITRASGISISPYESMFTVNDGVIKFYNVRIATMSFDATNNQNFVRIGNKGNVYMDNTRIDNITMDTSRPFIDVADENAKLQLVNVIIASNNVTNTNFAHIVIGNKNVKLSTLSIIGNNANDALFEFEGDGNIISTNSEIKGNNLYAVAKLKNGFSAKFDGEYKIQTNTNIGRILYAKGTAITNANIILKDYDISGYENKVLEVMEYAKVSMIGSTSITSNVIGSSIPVVEVDTNAMIELGDKFYIDNNNNGMADKANLKLNIGGYILASTSHPIATTSLVRITPVSDNQEVFRYWNENTIKGFNKIDNVKRVYLPNDIIKLDAAYDDYKVYKKGTLSEVSAVVGTDAYYVPLTFKHDNVIVATQYVAKNILTYVDKVMSDDDEMARHIWDASDTTPGVYTEWKFKDNDYNVNVNTPKEIILKIHKHKLCGATVSCTHYIPDSHITTEWYEIYNEQDFIKGYNNGKKYFVLATDCRITNAFALNNPFMDGGALCLNGNELKIDRGIEFIKLTNPLNNFIICDCGGEIGNRGCITSNNATTGSGYHIIVENTCKLVAYNVNFDGFNITNSNDTRQINVKNGGKLIMEGCGFNNNIINNASDYSLLNFEDTADITMHNVKFDNNTLIKTIDGRVDSLFTMKPTANVKLASVSFINNNSNNNLLKIPGTGNIVLSTLSFVNNTLTNYDGGLLSIDKTNVSLGKEIVFASNSGISLYVADNTTFVLDNKLKITNNDSEKGAIYVKNGTLKSMASLNSYTLDNNKGAGIYLYDSKFNIGNKLTISGKNDSTLVIDGIKTDTYEIDNLTIYGAKGNKDGAALKILANNVIIKNATISNANTSKDVIYVGSKNTIFENLNAEDNKATGSTICVNNTNAKLVFKGNTNIKNNTNGNAGAVAVKLGKVVVSDRLIVKDNRAWTTSINPRNVVIYNGILEGDLTNKLSSTSEIYVTANSSAETEVFKYWNENIIDGFGSPICFLPEKVFKLDSEYNGTTKKIYKKGIDNNISLYIGSNYKTIKFKKSESSVDVVATQYVANNVLTYVDKVEFTDVNTYTQRWKVPVSSGGIDIWNMIDEKNNIKLTNDIVATLISHRHTLCGSYATDSVAHLDGEIHNSFVDYSIVDTIDEMMANKSYKYFELANDLVINQSLDELLDGSAICLNGHKLIINKGIQVFNLTNKKIYLTDCAAGSDKGKITYDSTKSGSATTMFNVQGTGSLNLYNLIVDSVNIANTNSQRFINAAGGAVVISSTNLTNITNNGSDGFINVSDVNTKVVIDKVTISTITNANKFVAIKAGTADKVKINDVTINNVTNNAGYTIVANGTNELKLGKLNVKNNKSTGIGSIFYTNGGIITFASSSSVIRDNTGENGSVIRLENGKAKFTDNIIMNKNTSKKGGAIYVKGESDFLFEGAGKLRLVENKATTTDNKGKGGAVYYDNVKNFNARFGYIEFVNNEADYGSTYAFENVNNDVIFANGTIASDSKAKFGSIYVGAGSAKVIIDTCNVKDNGNATSVGGAIFIDKNATVLVKQGTMFSGNYNAIFNNSGTLMFATLSNAHAVNYATNPTNDIVFVNNKGDYVLSGNGNAKFDIGGGIFDNPNTTVNKTYAYKLTTPSALSLDATNVNFLFDGNVTFATNNDIRSIYVTNEEKETFKILNASDKMKLVFYVEERGTKVISDVDLVSGFGGAITYESVVYPEFPYRDDETSTIPWYVYDFELNGKKNLHIGYKTYEVVIDANGGKFNGLTSDSHRMVLPGVVNPTTYSILVSNGYKYNYLTTPSRIGYKFVRFSTSRYATDSTAIEVANNTVYSFANHGTTIYANWMPITYKIVFDKATISAVGSMEYIIATYDEALRLPAVEFTNPIASFSCWKDVNAIDYTSVNPYIAPRIEKTYNDEEIVINLRATENEIVTLYAVWDVGTTSVIFNSNAPISPMSGAINVVNGSMSSQEVVFLEPTPLNSNAYSIDGFEFIGWSETPLTATEAELIEGSIGSYYVDGQTITISDNYVLNLYAMWKRKLVTVNVMQNEEYATQNDPFVGIYSVKYDTRLCDNAPFNAVPVRAKYQPYTGMWTDTKLNTPYEKINYLGVLHSTNEVLRSLDAFTIYPYWKNEEYTITIDAGEGSIPSSYSNTFVGYLDAPYNTKGNSGEYKDENGKLLPTIATSWKVFKYYSLDAAGENEIDETTIFTDNTNLTIYAQYGYMNVNTIKYLPNGGTGTMEDTIALTGSRIRLPDVGFVRTNYRFDGWLSNNMRRFSNKQEIEINEDLELRAIWKYNNSGGENKGSGGGGGGGGPKTPYNADDKLFNPVNDNDVQKSDIQMIGNKVIWQMDYTINNLVGYNEIGVKYVGWNYVNSNGKDAWHYFNLDGTQKIGWFNDGGKYYYLDNEGEMVTGSVYIDGELCQFNRDGEYMVESVLAVNDMVSNKGVWNFDPVLANWNYLVKDEYGNLEKVKNSWFESDVTGGSCWYATDRDGNMLTGFVKSNNNIYYLQPGEFEKGKLLANTSVDLNGFIIYIDESGKVIGDTSFLTNSNLVYDMDVPILDANAINNTNMDISLNNVMDFSSSAGWVDMGIGLKGYIKEGIDKKGNKTYELAKGVTEIGGYYYYFDKNGIMRTGLTEINGNLYYLCEEKEMLGRVYVGYKIINGQTYYCDPLTGGIATKIS